MYLPVTMGVYCRRRNELSPVSPLGHEHPTDVPLLFLLGVNFRNFVGALWIIQRELPDLF